MPRNYSGDINGTFWAVDQRSDDAEIFGADCVDINYTPYIASNLQVCKAKLIELFEEIKVKPDLNMTNAEFHAMYEDNKSNASASIFASIELGLKIYECILEQGYCYLEADH